MKNNLLISISLTFISITVFAQIPSTYQKGTWKDFKTAAITYSFDDNTSNQIPVAIPLFDNYGYKVTFFTVTQSMNPNWNGLKNVANNGHEVASHTVTHADLSNSNVSTQDTELKNSQNTIQSQIPNKKCVSFAYPNCNVGDIATLQKYYIAARTCSGQIVSNSPTDFYRLSSIICGNTGVNSANDMNTRINSAKSSSGWCHFLMHGIDSDGGYSPLASSALSSHLNNVNTNKADFWVGTFGDVVKYIKERTAINVVETTITADSLRMTPTDNLDNAIYDVGVSLRRQLPATWTSARVMLGNVIVPSTIVTVNNTKYIQFDAVPDKGVYSISNPTAGPSCSTPAPTVSITSYNYEQNDPATQLSASGTSLKWYTVETGGTSSTTAPTPNTSVLGTTNYYVSQTQNTCEGPRKTITVNVTNTFKIYKVTAPITIDGTLENVWKNSTAQPMNATKLLTGTVSNTSDLSAYGKMLWDNDYLYLLAVVTDQTKVNDSQNSYDDDQVEFYLDMNNAKSTTYDADDYQYSFGWNDGTVVGTIPAAAPKTNISYAAVATSDGYVIEARIPWTTLTFTPEVDKLIGVDFMVNDDDDNGTRDGKLSWNATEDQAWQNASFFGTAKLVAKELITGIDFNNESFSIYPNPVSDYIKVDGLSGTFNYRVIDLAGVQVLKGNTNSEISVTALAQGSYILEIEIQGLIKTVQITK